MLVAWRALTRSKSTMSKYTMESTILPMSPMQHSKPLKFVPAFGLHQTR